MKKYGLTIILLILLSTITQAQNPDSIVSLVRTQTTSFPQEKLYVHNDKSLYISGETIWFRVHLVDAISHIYSPASLYVYGELLSPIDTIVSRVKVVMREAVHSGYFPLDEELPSGMYTMRFYTKYMQNLDEDYFFQKDVYVGHHMSTKYGVEPTFGLNKDKLLVDLKYVDVKTGEYISPTSVKVSDEKGELKEVKVDKDKVTQLSYNTSKKNMVSQIYIETEYEDGVLSQFMELPNVKEDDFDVSFFPEGGNLIAGVKNKIGYKALSQKGLGEDVTIVLYSQDGEEVSKSQSGHQGMGMILLEPKEGVGYYVKCTNSKEITKQFDLPKTLAEGYTLNIEDNGQAFLASVLSPNNQEISDPLLLLIHCRGAVIYAQEWDSGVQLLQVDRVYLPSGISQFLLVDQAYNPISERLVFNRNKEDIPSLAYTSAKSNHKKRSLINSEIKLNDSQGNPINGNVSISVTDNMDMKVDSVQNIVFNLLLTSDIKGHVEDPAFYFEDTRKAADAQDLLMMTQGWRRYNMADVLKGKPQTPMLPIEQANIITGMVKNGLFLNKAAKNVPVNVLTYRPLTTTMFETDEEGRFALTGYDIVDSTEILIMATTKDGKDDFTQLTMDPIVFPNFKRTVFNNTSIKQTIQLNDYLKKADMKYMYENGPRMVNLDEVVVTGRARKKALAGRSGFSSPAFNPTYDEEAIARYKASSVMSLFRQLSGVHVVGGGDVIIRGEKVLVLVDEKEEPDFVSTGSVDDIAEIEVIKQGSMFWGDRGANGVVLVTTKTGYTTNTSRKANRAVLNNIGYQAEKEFYTPKFQTLSQKQDSKPDLRTTIHWQPSLDIKDGKVNLEFYSADASTTYSVLIEGVTERGGLIHQVATIDRTQED